MTKLNIAVLGAGISGLSVAWLLSKNHKITVFEKDDRFGGHSNTVDFDTPEASIPVDTGFIVYNTQTYPNLISLFNHLDVETLPTKMTFSVSLENGNYEYSGSGYKGLFGQRTNLIDFRHWRMVLDIARFLSRAAGENLDQYTPDITLGDYLNRGGYSQAFVNKHILPMGAAIWSTSGRNILNFPAASFIRFFANHGLLKIRNRPQWRTVKDGSRTYVNKLISQTSGEFFCNRKACRIRRTSKGVIIEDSGGTESIYDHVVIATHADQALALLEDADIYEQKLLTPFKYTNNHAVLHSDNSMMPKRRNLWSSWNYISGNSEQSASLLTTYWMNNLQSLDTTRNIFLTLNPESKLSKDKIQYSVFYKHPIFDRKAIEAQRHLWRLQGSQRTWFCGSYFGYGFHEDGLQSGLAVAERLGGRNRPWNLRSQFDRNYFDNKTSRPKLMEAAE